MKARGRSPALPPPRRQRQRQGCPPSPGNGRHCLTTRPRARAQAVDHCPSQCRDCIGSEPKARSRCVGGAGCRKSSKGRKSTLMRRREAGPRSLGVGAVARSVSARCGRARRSARLGKFGQAGGRRRATPRLPGDQDGQTARRDRAQIVVERPKLIAVPSALKYVSEGRSRERSAILRGERGTDRPRCRSMAPLPIRAGRERVSGNDEQESGGLPRTQIPAASGPLAQGEEREPADLLGKRMAEAGG